MTSLHRVLATATALCLLASGAAAQELTLRLSSENSPGSNSIFIMERFKENIEAELGADNVSVEIFHSGALGDEAVHLQQIRTGQIDIHPTGSDAVQLDPKWAIFDMPFLFADRNAVRAVLDGEIGAEMRASMRERAGVEVLGFGEIGFRQITNNVRPIVVPEDLAGLKIRVPGSRMRVLMFETYGAAPLSLNLSELYLALQQGAVDAQENPLLAIRSQSYQEVQEYLSFSNHVYTPITLSMNGQKWDSLTEAQRAAVQRAADAAIEWTRENGEAMDTTIREEFEGQIAMNEIDLAAFQDASAPIWAAVAETAGQEFVDRVIAAASPAE
jgi:tripartite ATP-independent transporter DctP family solute receptor